MLLLLPLVQNTSATVQFTQKWPPTSQLQPSQRVSLRYVAADPPKLTLWLTLESLKVDDHDDVDSGVEDLSDQLVWSSDTSFARL